MKEFVGRILDSSHNHPHKWIAVFIRQVGSCVCSQNLQGHGKEQRDEVATRGTPGPWTGPGGEAL